MNEYIWLVDDVQLFPGELAARLERQFGLPVHCATSSEEAKRFLKSMEYLPRVALINPDLGLLVILSLEERCPGIPTVLLGGTPSVLVGMSVGAHVQALTRPHTYQVLAAAVERLLGTGSADDANGRGKLS